MNEQMFEELAKKYPHLFKKASVDSFEIGPGWYTLVDVLCSMFCGGVDSKIYSIEYENSKEVPNQDYIKKYQQELDKLIDELPVIDQVKEKFGGLRFYVSGGTPAHHNYIAFAEYMSVVTCEMCGAPGQRRNDGWIATLCDKHHRERELERSLTARPSDRPGPIQDDH